MSILGGLLSGIGKGMETQALHNRELALENLRNERLIAAEGRAETREIAKEGRTEEISNRAAKRDQGYKIETLNRSGEISSAQSNQEFGQRVTLAQMEHQFSLQRDNNNASNQQALQKARHDLENGTVTHFETTDSGEVVGLTGNGGVVKYNFKAQPKAKTAAEVEAETAQKKQNQRTARDLAKKGLGEWQKGTELKPGMRRNGMMYIGGDKNDRNNWVAM